MERYSNYDDTITGLQNEVSKYSFNPALNQTVKQVQNEPNFITSKSIPKINFNKVMIAVPIILFALLVYFKPEFVMIDKPYDRRGKRINYGKVVITVACISGLIYFVKCSYN